MGAGADRRWRVRYSRTDRASIFVKDLSDFEICPLPMPKLETWQKWAGFDVELGGHISMVYLEAEAAAF